MEIDIYDFDKTIVPFDSGTKFVIYCMIHYPWCILTLPIMAIAGILMILHIIDFTSFKKICFIFLPMIPKDKAVKNFWDKNIDKVYPWFNQRNRYCVVISASPDFLLTDISKRLNFDELICTIHNPKSGIIIGENCRNEEKVKRLFEVHPKNSIKVMDVYSDSLNHDKPIFSLATNQCYHIVDGEKIPFRFEDVYTD